MCEEKLNWRKGSKQILEFTFGTSKVLAAEIWPVETNTKHQSGTRGASLDYEPNPGGGSSSGYHIQKYDGTVRQQNRKE